MSKWQSYPPTSSSPPHTCRSPPGRGGPEPASGERQRWPRVFGPHPELPGSGRGPSRASCGKAFHPPPETWAHTPWGCWPTPSRRLHPTGAWTGTRPQLWRNDCWHGCDRRPCLIRSGFIFWVRGLKLLFFFFLLSKKKQANVQFQPSQAPLLLFLTSLTPARQVGGGV